MDSQLLNELCGRVGRFVRAGPGLRWMAVMLPVSPHRDTQPDLVAHTLDRIIHTGTDTHRWERDGWRFVNVLEHRARRLEVRPLIAAWGGVGKAAWYASMDRRLYDIREDIGKRQCLQLGFRLGQIRYVDAWVQTDALKQYEGRQLARV